MKNNQTELELIKALREIAAFKKKCHANDGFAFFDRLLTLELVSIAEKVLKINGIEIE